MNKHKPRILIMCRSDASMDPRPLRMIGLCENLGFHVSLLSAPPTARPTGKDTVHIAQPTPKIGRKLRVLVCSLLLAVPLTDSLSKHILRRLHGIRVQKRLANSHFQAVSVHDIELLPDALELAAGAPVFFDARELYTKQYENNLFFRMFVMKTRQKLCRSYLPRCAYVQTVSQGLRQSYLNAFGIDATVVRSLPDFQSLMPSTTANDTVRLVHHGIANSNRSLEQLIRMTDLLDARFKLDLYLTGDRRKISYLKKLSKSHPKVRVLPPISFSEIIPTLNRYDVGVAFFPPLTQNLKYCLPNKFFEFIQARLALAIGPSPDMSALVNQYKLGLVTKDFSFETLATELNTWTRDDIAVAKQMSHQAAEDLCFEKERKIIEDALRKHRLLPPTR